jgi:hypothetical protein
MKQLDFAKFVANHWTLVYRVPDFLSSRPNWVHHPPPATARECCSSPTLDPRGETHSVAGKGVGGTNSDEGTDTLVLYVLYAIIPLWWGDWGGGVKLTSG